jgi:phosphohistidine phosphatase
MCTLAVMDVLVIRHGHAVDLSGDLRIDGHRWLTTKGRTRTRDVGKLLRKEGVRFDAIRTSPLVRAAQTAELVAEETRYEGEITVAPSLVPSDADAARALALALEGLSTGMTVALVGHEPLASALVGELLSRPAPSLPKSGVVCVRLDGKKPVLRFAIDPKRLKLVDSLGDLSD